MHKLKHILTEMKIFIKYIVSISLTILLFVSAGCGKTSETTINEFLIWKLNQKQSAENKEVQDKLPTESISSYVLFIDALSNKTIKLYELDMLLTKADIDTMNQQIKYLNNTTKWDSKNYKFPFINPDTLTDSGMTFLELSIPIFSKNKQICLFKSNINCHQNYCHDELLAIYRRQSATEWKIIKVLHHTTF